MRVVILPLQMVELAILIHLSVIAFQKLLFRHFLILPALIDHHNEAALVMLWVKLTAADEENRHLVNTNEDA